MRNVFILGSKGIPAKYGGFETFVEYLTKNQISNDIAYHVACLSEINTEFEHNNVRCFNVKVPSTGSSRAVLYDINALKETIKYIKEHEVKNAIVYILACRIGPFISKYKRQLAELGAELYVNPDGHEWKRSKWSMPIRMYWKISEKLMVKYADLLVCDSKGIEAYIKSDYSTYKPNTTFIAYGADVTPSEMRDNDSSITSWQKKNKVKPNEYYLIVGRFVPENNYELMIREFLKSESQKDLVIISNVEKNEFYKELLRKTQFDQDMRIKFVGTVYDQELLQKIREQAYGYLHGHEVGGTNPSLLEALASTKLNLLLKVNFNREVGSEGAIYFDKQEKNLANLINHADSFTESQIDEYSIKAKERIMEEYSWGKIVSQYEELFLENNKPLEV